MDSLDDNTRSDILSHLNNTCQSMHMSVPHNPTSPPPLSPIVPNLPHCTTHEDPCYHCYSMPYTQPHFFRQTAELLPGHNLMSPQLFEDQITNHSSTSPRNRFEKSRTKSHSDSSLIKMNLVPGHPFSHTPTSPRHSSPTSTIRHTALTREQANRPEPVWRPW